MRRFVPVLAALCAVASYCQPALASRYAYLPQSSTGEVQVFDTQTNQPLATLIAVGTTPMAVATHPAGHRVYIVNLDSDSVSVIDTASNTVVANVPVGDAPYHVAVSPDGREVYVPNYNDGTVSIIDTASNTVTDTLPGLPGANAVAFSPSGRYAYVTDYSAGQLYTINTQTHQFTSMVAPAGSEGIAVHPSGRQVYVTSVNNGDVWIYNTVLGSVTTVSLGLGSGWGVAAHPNGRYFYVATSASEVAVVRTSDLVLTASVNVGSATPLGGISLTPTGHFAYVADQGSDKVHVINTTTNTVQSVGQSGSGSFAMGTAIQRPLFGQGAIAAGQNHTCRIRADQTLDCWGRNDAGQANAPPGEFTQVVAGSAHSCAVRVDGTVACWGNNAYGQLGVPAFNDFQRLSAGARHTCGIRGTGEAVCWGQDTQLQAQAPGVADYQDIAGGSSHSCALGVQGFAFCWGRGTEGQVTPPLSSFVQVVTGAAFSCGLLADHTVACWGDATAGKTLPPGGAFAALYAQSERACGLRYDGAIECWGANLQGEGNAPALVHAEVAMGRSHTCSLQALGVAQCWGASTYNQAPQFALEGSVPATVTSNENFVTRQISMVVSNPGVPSPYAPRSPVYAVGAGVLPPGLVLSSSGELSGRPLMPGSFSFTVEAEELNGFTAARDITITVGANDSTAPVITPTVTGMTGTNGWYRGNVVVSWSVVDEESEVDYTSGCATVVISSDTAGATVVCEAGSPGGLGSQSVLIRLDKTAPTGVPVLSNNRPLLNEPISVVANGLDATSGVASQVCDATPTDTVSLAGARAYCLVTDVAGNSSRRPFAYRVVYGFQGFTGTVRNPGYWNAAGLGQPITFHYRVVDFTGAPVTGLASAFMGGATLACPAKTANTAPVSPAPDGLVEIGDGRYEFTWTSLSSPACVRLFLGLGDGNTNNRALFKFQ